VSEPRNVLVCGDVREVCARWAAEHGRFVQTVMTSVPYWALRKYEGVGASLWGVTDPDCEHVWGPSLPKAGSEHRNGLGANSEFAGRADKAEIRRQLHPGQVPDRKNPHAGVADAQTTDGGAYCQRCGCWRGMLGLEPHPGQYVANIVECFRAVASVLRTDGTCWVNCGDSYASGNCGGGSPVDVRRDGRPTRESDKVRGRDATRERPRVAGLKPKDLCGIPWRVAFALQADGWYLRSAIVWAKGLSFCDAYAGSVMPESCRDRPTSAYEMVFLLAHPESGGRYYYDAEAVREKHADWERGAHGEHVGCKDERPDWNVRSGTMTNIDRGGARRCYNPAGRNLRNVWTLNPEPTRRKHYAAFPQSLVIPCIKAGTSERGQCPQCGAPWARVVETRLVQTQATNTRDGRWGGGGDPLDKASNIGMKVRGYNDSPTLGWRPTCDCDAGEPVPQIAFDPFMGSGTVALVATMLGRHYVGTDASPVYTDMARERLAEDCPLFAKPEGSTLFANGEQDA